MVGWGHIVSDPLSLALARSLGGLLSLNHGVWGSALLSLLVYSWHTGMLGNRTIPGHNPHEGIHPDVRILRQHLVDGSIKQVRLPGALSTLHAIAFVIGAGTDTFSTQLNSFTLSLQLSLSLSLPPGPPL